jgi:hypothetical protein
MRKHYMITYTAAHARDIATFTTYLWQGFDEAHKSAEGEHKDLYEEHSGRHSGQIGIVMDLYYYANWIFEFMLAFNPHDELIYDGVFEYEVVEGLGSWLFYNPDCFEDGPEVSKNFEEFASEIIPKWFKAEPLQKESTTTMTINDLITHLTVLKSEGKGDYDVLTRGSESTKMVDVSDVRLVKTAKRRAVFIGKPKV